MSILYTSRYLVCLGLILIFSPAFSQQLASVVQSSPTHQDERKALDDVIHALEDRYQVRFNFNSQLTRDKFVNTAVLDTLEQNDLEVTLRQLLPSFHLDYEKIGAQHYVIYDTDDATPHALETLEREKPKQAWENQTIDSQVRQRVDNKRMQQRLLALTISGTVVDLTDNTPLPGVNIVVKGTSIGTVTDVEGNYRLDVPDSAQTLVFSSVGYSAEEVAIGGRSIIDIAMAPDIQSLQEVVVVGYGQQEEKDVTGVVSSVDAEDFNRGAIVNPDQLIAGKVPGVQITSNGGAPGGQTSVRIRGGTSINASNEPLYVIDGVPINNEAYNPGGFSEGRNPLNFLNPNDIETFTVLKDASATAIYGSRGANGVILITTKGGSLDGGLTYDAWASVANIIDKTDVFGAEQFRQITAEQAPDRLDLLTNVDTDWQEAVLQPAYGQNHALSFSGGSEKVLYRASLGYLNQEGIIESSNTERISLALNYNHQLFDDQLTVDGNIKIARTQDQFAPDAAIGNAVSFAPTQPIYDPNSVWGGFWEWEQNLGTKNPVAEIALTEDFGTNYRSLGNVQFDYQLPFVEGLSAKLNLGYDVASGDRRRFQPSFLRSQEVNGGEIRLENFTRTNALLETYVNYTRDLPGISSALDVTAGYSYQDFRNEYPGYRAFELSSNVLSFNNPAPAEEFQAFNSVEENRLISAFGRVNYAFKDRYLLTLTVRRDGSSRFGEANRWGTFPSAALAWRLSDEPFMQGIRSISDLKFRVGWGITGNQEIGNYRYLKTYAFGDNRTQVQFGDQFVTTIRPGGADPTLKWEETQSVNVGLDYGLLEGRISGSLEYYYKRTDDLLFEVIVPAGANLTNIVLTNIGAVKNEGVELGISAYVVRTDNLSWNVGFNAAYNNNEILELSGGDDPSFQGIATGGISGGQGNNIQILREGEPVNAFFVFRHIMDEDGSPRVDTEDYNEDGAIDLADIYEDTNDDGIVNDNDRVAYQQPAPDVTLGLTSQLYVKNFDLSFTMRGSLGNYVYNNVASNFGNYSRVISDIVPANMHRSVATTDFREPQLFSDYYVEEASFLRMDNITLGYTFPKLADRLSIRLYGTAQNLFILTNYSGLDPEFGDVGIDDNIFPRARTFILGLNVGL